MNRCWYSNQADTLKLPSSDDICETKLHDCSIDNFNAHQATSFVIIWPQKITPTRMHSSRMRTVRNSSRLQGGGGWCTCLGGGGYLIPGGCTWSQGGVPGLGGVYLVSGVNLAWGCTWSRGVVPARGCTWSRGVYLPRYPPPWTEWLTDRCKNITFANFVCGR